MTAPEDPFRTPPPGGSPAPSPHGTPPSGYEQPAYGQPPAQGQQPYGQQQYGQQPYGHPVAARRNGLGTAALVLGVLGLLTSVFLVGGLLGLVAVVLGVLGLGRVKRREADNRGVALAGVITGALALLVTIGLVAAGVALFNSEEFSDVRECLEAAQTQEEIDRCAADFEQTAG